ncbi:Protein yellow [Blattella germanica]|nr:Protein yellow [Blattella germanica]
MVLLWHSLPLVLCVASCLTDKTPNANIEDVFHWKFVDFHFPDEDSRNKSIESKAFIQANNLPLGVERWHDKLFVTVPRWKAGVPSTLNYISLKETDKSPKLIPYPDLASNTLPENKIEETDVENGTHIISVFRIRADACDRLWVMDTGVDDVVGEYRQLAPPRILVYDLHNDTLIHSFTFNHEHVKEDSFFANINVDVESDNCDDAYAYIPDLGSYGVVVYSLKDDDSWRIKHHYFHMDPLQGNYSVGGVNFHWTDGIFSFALSPRQEDGFKTAYFHALSSTHEFSVSTKVLRNKTIATDPHNFEEFKQLGYRGPNSQATASFLDESTGVVFYTQVNRNGVGCWNSKSKEYTPQHQHLVVSDDETFVFPNDLKVDHDGNLWVLTDRLPVFIYKELDPEKVNFYIFKGVVKDLIKGTVCDH